jgi:hypothetical protein
MPTHKKLVKLCDDFLASDSFTGLPDKIRRLLFYGGRIQALIDRLAMRPMPQVMRILEECQVLCDLYMDVLIATVPNTNSEDRAAPPDDISPMAWWARHGKTIRDIMRSPTTQHPDGQRTE